jgi:hypothetical protein
MNKKILLHRQVMAKVRRSLHVAYQSDTYESDGCTPTQEEKEHYFARGTGALIQIEIEFDTELIDAMEIAFDKLKEAASPHYDDKRLPSNAYASVPFKVAIYRRVLDGVVYLTSEELSTFFELFEELGTERHDISDDDGEPLDDVDEFRHMRDMYGDDDDLQSIF